MLLLEYENAVSQTRPSRQGAFWRGSKLISLVEYFRNRLLLLWATVLIVMLGIASQVGLFYVNAREWEQARLTHNAEITMDAFVRHSVQVINQADTLLQSVRGFYLDSESATKTEKFIHSLPFDRSIISDVYLVDDQAKLLISHDPSAKGRSVADHDHYQFQHAAPGDQIFIGSVDGERETGMFHFRVSRRINRADGSFAGEVLCTVNPESFSSYYQQLMGGTQNIASLLGTADKKLRARSPPLLQEYWQSPVQSVLWDLLVRSPSGRFTDTSQFDGIKRIFVYKKVPALPLIVVTGFSESDILDGVQERMRWAGVGSMTVLIAIFILASMLTVEIRRRDEQDSFMSMLSHELKTPLSVLRMVLDQSAPSDRTLAHAKQSIHDMDTIICRCLEADQLQQRNMQVNRQRCQIRELLEDLQSCCTAPQSLQITMPDLPSLNTDRQLLSIALNNLIENALKYAERGSMVQISARHHGHQGHNGILLSVLNAPGSAGTPDARQVFKKYYRSPGAHSKTGSGLGLYLVHHVAKQLGGWVRYAPRDNQVVFEFWLPIC